MTSIVIPAHNEAGVLPRLLEALTADRSLAFQIVVVANGCTDATAEVARRYPVTVLESPVPSKIRALALGDASATSYPRLYVDGDVVLGVRDVDDLVAALRDGVHAAGPERVFIMDGVGRAVRWYYGVWQQLEGVRTELYGRGVVAVDETGHDRLRSWPETMSDDLHIAMTFSPHERVVAESAHVLIWPPKTYRDLVRRRVRAMTGNARMAADPDAPPVRPSGAKLSAIARIVRRQPRLLGGGFVFLGTAALSRILARRAVKRGDITWLRDQSSRERA